MSASSTPAVSPLAPAAFPALPPIAGVRLGAVAAGIRYRGRQPATAEDWALLFDLIKRIVGP